jgi:hypothetical protein
MNTSQKAKKLLADWLRQSQAAINRIGGMSRQ